MTTSIYTVNENLRGLVIAAPMHPSSSPLSKWHASPCALPKKHCCPYGLGNLCPPPADPLQSQPFFFCHIVAKRLPHLRETEVVTAGGDSLEQLITERVVALVFGEIKLWYEKLVCRLQRQKLTK